MISQPHWSVGLFFAACGLILIAGAGRTLFKTPKWIKPFRGPVIALEFARTPADAADAFAEAGRNIRVQAARKRQPDVKSDDAAARDAEATDGASLQEGREWLAKQIELDQRIMIPAYVVIFSAAAVLVWWCAPPVFGLWPHVAGVVLCLALVGVAAGFDVVENGGNLEAIEATKNMDRARTLAADIAPALERASRAAALKFGLLYCVLLVLAAPVVMRGGWGVGLGALFVAVAVFGLVSLLPARHGWIEWAFTLMGVCLLLTGLWLFRPPPAPPETTTTNAAGPRAPEIDLLPGARDPAVR